MFRPTTILVLLALQVYANLEHISSSTTKYNLCTLLSKGGNGMVYTAIRSPLSEEPAVCDLSAERVIVKCAVPSFQPVFESEYAHMLTLQSESWAPRVFEMFSAADGGPCLAMERLGIDLERLRLGYTGKWPSETLGSIGARMVDIVSELHNNFGITHTDMHLGNFALGLPDSDGSFSRNLFVIDFGDTRPLVDSDTRSAKLDALLEVRQIVISIRYLFDADFTFYVDKRYEYNESQICDQIPTSLCEALQYVYSLSEEDTIDYPKLKEYFENLMGSSSDGQIHWQPLIDTLGWPVLAKEKNLFKIAQEGHDEPDQGPQYGPSRVPIPSNISTNKASVQANSDSTTTKSVPITFTLIAIFGSILI